MGDQAAGGVEELGLGERRTTSALDDRALGAQPAGVDGDRPEELHGQVERGVALAGCQGRVHRAAGGGVEQRREMTPPWTEPIGL